MANHTGQLLKYNLFLNFKNPSVVIFIPIPKTFINNKKLFGL